MSADRDALTDELAELIYLHAFAAFKVRGRMAPPVERANRDTARRTAEKVVAYVDDRFELSPKQRRPGDPPGA